MLFVSILTSDRSLDPELWALVWQGERRPGIKLIGAYNLLCNKRLLIWEGESRADLRFMDRFNQVGLLETHPALDQTEGWQGALAGDLEGLRWFLVREEGASPDRVESAIELRTRAKQAPTIEAARREARDWVARRAESAGSEPSGSEPEPPAEAE